MTRSLPSPVESPVSEFAGHRAEPLVARGQRQLAQLARRDVDDQADHAPRGSILGAVHDVGAIEGPVPAAVGVPEPVLGLEHLRGRVDVHQLAAELVDGALGIGAEDLPPVHVVGAAECRVDTEHAVVAVGVVRDAVLDVPVPHARGS
jgi:hypothetical protein